MDRFQILAQAASLDQSTFAANELIKNRRFDEACRKNWAPFDGTNGVQIDDTDAEIPVLDIVTQTPLTKDDVVVLSDGQCYSRESMKQLLAQGVVELSSGRASLPITKKQMSDLDYALLDTDPPTPESTAAARARTSDVRRTAYLTQATPGQRQLERLLRDGVAPAQAVAELERLRQEDIVRRRGLRVHQSDALPEPEEQLAQAIETGDIGRAARLVGTLGVPGLPIFNHDVATNDALLKHLANRIAYTNNPAQTLRAILHNMRGSRNPYFSISVLADIYPEDIIEQNDLLSTFLRRNMFLLDDNVEKYVTAIGKAQAIASLDNDDNRKYTKLMEDMINEIYGSNLYGVKEKRNIPNLIHAFLLPIFEKDVENGTNFGMIIQRELREYWQLQLLQQRLPFEEQPLAAAIARKDRNAIDIIASSGTVFQHDFLSNNHLLAHLSMMDEAFNTLYGIENILRQLPQDRQLFETSALADIYGAPPDDFNFMADVAAEKAWKDMPNLFRLDSDVVELDRFAQALAHSALSAADEGNKPKINTELIIKLVDAIYSRHQPEPAERSRRVIGAFMHTVVASDAVNGTNRADTARTEIEDAFRRIRTQYTQAPPSRRTDDQNRAAARTARIDARENPMM